MIILTTLKKYHIGLFFIACLICANGAAAQSIIGKWNQTTVKQYLTDDGAKSSGKPYVETNMAAIGAVVYEFKSDKTYVMTSTAGAGGDQRIYKGSWSLTGNALIMSATTGGQSITSTVSFQSGDLVIETLHPESKKTRKVVLTFKKV
jgi:hypothetical protein